VVGDDFHQTFNSFQAAFKRHEPGCGFRVLGGNEEAGDIGSDDS
jgi:hypothetical protein